MESESVPEELIHAAIRRGTLARVFQPVLCGASLDYIGVQPVLDAGDSLPPQPHRPTARLRSDTQRQATG
ncbi:MAG UNVERIFIED_CONTAM: hypothetical protein LVR18_31585 [Planctomycetaceae bacterium]